jgi:pimeloyl-ACP methyl ester carboxylesterase
VIVAFRGTYSITNTIADLSTMPQEYIPYPGDDDGGDPDAPKCTNCTVHTGFYTSWQHTRIDILPHIAKVLKEFPEYKVTLVGHSLGGAVAAFAALELLNREFTSNLSITTFGEPRIGNDALASYVNARFNLSDNSTQPDSKPYRRVTHISDPVPQLPLAEWGYVPHGGEIFISKAEVPPTATDIRHCDGNADPGCIAQTEEAAKKAPWAFPGRFKLWQLFFAHRDYFWRLGLCVPGGDPFSHWEVTENVEL